MLRTVIADTSTLILFSKIERFDILEKVYGRIITTPKVLEEFGENSPEWIEVKDVANEEFLKLLEIQLDEGEASVIALGKELKDVLLLLDDLKARKLAKRLDFKITGSLGIIHKAKQLGVIENVKPILNQLLETDFRISNKIITEILKLNNESS